MFTKAPFLGLCCLIVFINDLFCFIKEAKLSNYADDNQLYFGDTDPAVVEHVLNKELVVVCEWFRNNKMILKTLKYMQGTGSVRRVKPTSSSPRLLNFGKRITKIGKKVGKQLDVLCRQKKSSFRTKLCLDNSFIMSHLEYCSSVWHHCLKKLHRLYERAICYLYSVRFCHSY